MKKKALIWDLDGTLLDYYKIIVASLRNTLLEMGISMKDEEILRFVTEYSVNLFIKEIANKTSIPIEKIKKRYSEISDVKTLEIKPITNAEEMLKGVSDNGVLNYVYTHRGKSSHVVLQNIGLKSYFTEIVTSENGFNRKPSPDAVNYLVEKYELDKRSTYYVGDRSIDIECAKNAGIRSILYLPKKGYGMAKGKEDYIVQDLLDIINIMKE